MTTKVKVDFENASGGDVPDEASFFSWVDAVVSSEPVELGIRVVTAYESAELNQTYRNKSGPTNVLSFPCDLPEWVPEKILGDIVLCRDVIEREALEQSKTQEAHWAHMVIHGVLHLQGYDHIEETDAQVMENREIMLLGQLGFQNPYEENSVHDR